MTSDAIPKRTAIAFCVACALVGYLVGNVKGLDPLNPLRPSNDRPVLKFLSKVAKIGLWVAVFAETQPTTPEQQYAHTRKHYSEDSLVCHQEGW